MTTRLANSASVRCSERSSPVTSRFAKCASAIGAFVGDGSITRKQGVNGGTRWAKVTFSVPTTDRAHERLVDLMQFLAPGVQPTVRTDGVAITWNSVELADLFEANGFTTGAHVK